MNGILYSLWRMFVYSCRVVSTIKRFSWKKNYKLFQILILFDDNIKESVKVTNVQKCDFSQFWTLSFQKFPGSMPPDPPRRAKNFFSPLRDCKIIFYDRPPTPSKKILDRTLVAVHFNITFDNSRVFFYNSHVFIIVLIAYCVNLSFHKLRTI